jgi:hypothetical protein
MGMRQPTYRPDGGDARPVLPMWPLPRSWSGRGSKLFSWQRRKGSRLRSSEASHGDPHYPPVLLPHGPVTKGRRGDVEDLPLHGAGHTHPVLLPRASDDGETWEEEQRWRLGFEGTREWHARGRKGEKKWGSRWLLGTTLPLSPWPRTRYPRRRHRCRERTQRRVAVRHAGMGWWGEDEMRLKKTILPLATQQKHRQSHRVSLLPISGTQEATRMPSPTSRPRTTLAPHLSDRG